MVPGEDSRVLQTNRQYRKLDFQDFLDYATSSLPPQPGLNDFPDGTAVFFDSLNHGREPREPHATWNLKGVRTGIRIVDAVIARDRVLITLIVRFSVFPNSPTTVAELPSLKYVASLTFVPGPYSRSDLDAMPLVEWERGLCIDPLVNDEEWEFLCAGEYTEYLIQKMTSNVEEDPQRTHLAYRMREHVELLHTRYGVQFEVARLMLHLPSYWDFMYDLIVEEKHIAVRKKSSKNRTKKRQSTAGQPIYKIVKSINIIRPNTADISKSQGREWTAPSYSFAVQGHWRKLQSPTSKGRDQEGNVIYGKTWVRTYRKYENKGSKEIGLEIRKRDPGVTIEIKQQLSFARDVIRAYESDGSDSEHRVPDEYPSDEWMATERAKLTAGMRYQIIQRDNFRCRLCGVSASESNYVKLEVDHIRPVKRWGTTTEDNLQTLCRQCNQGKSDY